MEAARLFVTVGADTKSAEGALSSFDQKLKSLASGMTKAGTAMTLGITAPLAMVAKNALGMAADYEQSMNVLQASIGATDKQMAKMSERAMQLGAETSFSAGEAAEGMLELGKAGMNATQIYDAMPGVLALAAAGQISVAEASAVTASTLNAFGLEAAESTRIADLLAGAANASQANISDLSQGMQQAGFAFKMTNQPVEYLAASLALLTDNGLTGSDAGTALKNAMMGMINPTNEAKAEMDRLGISFYDAQGNMKQMPDIIGMLDTALDGMTAQQRDSAMSTMFLGDAMKALTPLLEAGQTGFEETVAAVTEVGAASKVSDALMKGLGGGLEYLSGSVETFLLGAGLPFTETLGDWARQLADTITAFGELPQETQNLALGILAFTAAAGPAIAILGLLGTSIAAVGWPVALAALAIIGLGIAWGFNLGGIRDKTAEIVPVITEWFTELSTKATEVGAALQGAWEVFSTAASGKDQSVEEKTKAYSKMMGVFSPDTITNIAMAGTALNNFGTAVQTAFDKTTFPDVDKLWADFKAGDFETVATTIKDTAYELMVNLNTELKITGTIDALKTKIQSFVTQMTADIASLDFGEAGSKIAEKINGLTGAINDIDLSNIDWVGVLTRVLLGPLGTAIGALKWALEPGQLSALVDAVKGAIGTIAWGDLGTSFSGLATAIGGQLVKVGQDIIRDFKAAFPTVPTTPTVKEVQRVTAPEPVRGRDFDWEAVGAAPAKMIKAMIDSVVNFDWSAAGVGIGAAIGVWFAGEVAKVKFFQDNPTLITGFNESWNAFQKQIGTEMRAGWDEAIGEDPFGRLAEGIRTGWSDFIEGLVSTLMGAFVQPASKGGLFMPTMPGTSGEIGAGEPPPFQWSDYITPLDWGITIPPLEWSSFTPNLDWGTLAEPIAWPDFITALGWATYVPTLSWGEWIEGINWGSFVPDIEWNNFVPDMGWGDFIPNLDWGRFISWLAIPGFANGTMSAPGGAAIVGERGPELVLLPHGSRVYDNEETRAMASGMTVNINVASLNSDIDIHSIAAKVAREIARRTR